MKTSILAAACLLLWSNGALALDIRGPYLIDLRSDRATIVCHLEREAEVVLRYHEVGAKNENLEEQSPGATRHVFRIKNLKPGTRYSYKVCRNGGAEDDGNCLAGPYVFFTPSVSDPTFSFIAYGDSRDSNKDPKRHKQVASHFLKHSPRFIVSTGDLLLGGETASRSMFGQDWSLNFFRPLRGVIEAVPYYLTVGNHDEDSPEVLEGVLQAFPSLKPSLHYAFRVANTHFVFLHVANRMKEFEAQKEWFVKELESAVGADWRIVFLHVSPFTNGKYRDSQWTLSGREDFLRTCVEHKVDLVLSGHDHSYQRFHPLKMSDGDPHAVLFVVTALAGTNPYPAGKDGYTAKVINNTDHFCVVDVSRESLALTAYDRQDKPFDHVTLGRGDRPLGMVWKPVGPRSDQVR